MTTSAAIVRVAKATARALLVEQPARRRHSAVVASRAELLASGIGTDDRRTVVAAAWLHDVGHASRLQSTGLHALDGARFLESRFPPRIVALVAHHSGARHEAQLRGLGENLDGYPRERSRVADLLTYCDLTTGPNGEHVDVAARFADVERRYGTDHVVTQALYLARPEINLAVARVECDLSATATGQRSAAAPPAR